MAATTLVLACATCFGEPGSDTLQGLVVGSAVLLALVALAQFGVGRLLLRVARAERASASLEEVKQ